MLKQPPQWDHVGNPDLKASCVLAEKSDYDGGDPSLDLEKRNDGRYDLVIYRGVNDLTVHALSGRQVREAALRILALVPETE